MNQEKQLYVYILTNKPYGTLYIGQTNNLARRIYEHQNNLIEGFTKRYGLKRLVYYEIYANPSEGFLRERRMKEWQREWKIKLIMQLNPSWKDLTSDLAGI